MLLRFVRCYLVWRSLLLSPMGTRSRAQRVPRPYWVGDFAPAVPAVWLIKMEAAIGAVPLLEGPIADDRSELAFTARAARFRFEDHPKSQTQRRPTNRPLSVRQRIYPEAKCRPEERQVTEPGQSSEYQKPLLEVLTDCHLVARSGDRQLSCSYGLQCSAGSRILLLPATAWTRCSNWRHLGPIAASDIPKVPWKRLESK